MAAYALNSANAICCTVHGNLIRIIEGLMRRPGRFAGILIETKDLADTVILNKTDLVDEDGLASVELRIRRICRFALNPENRPQRFQKDSGALNLSMIT